MTYPNTEIAYWVRPGSKGLALHDRARAYRARAYQAIFDSRAVTYGCAQSSAN